VRQPLVCRSSAPPNPGTRCICNPPGTSVRSSPRLSPRPRRTEPSDGHLVGPPEGDRPGGPSCLPRARLQLQGPPDHLVPPRRILLGVGQGSTVRPPIAWSSPTPTGP
jgi:hypothetical protein